MLRLSRWRGLRHSTVPLETLAEIGGFFAVGSRAYHASSICHRQKSTKTKKLHAAEKGFGQPFRPGSRFFEGESANQAGSARPRARPWQANPHSFKPDLAVAPLESEIDEAYARTARTEQLDSFLKDSDVFRRCACFGIDQKQFDTWSAKFADAASSDKIEKLKPANLIALLARGGKGTLGDFIVNQFFAYLAIEAPDVVKNTKFL
ncbi:hypothetical protein IWW57_005426, partial [Coemansia sp. S610]